MAGSSTAVGESVPQGAAPAKVSGRARYVADLSLPGMLIGAVVRSPHPHARIARIDTRAAQSLAGVRAVLTGADVPPRPWGPIIAQHHILAVDRVRFAGEEVVAIAAEDDDTAREAAELVEVQYEPLPAVFDVEEALRADAPEVHAGTGNVARELTITRGDVDEAFARGDVVMHDAVYEVPRQYHGYMEPMGTLAEVDAGGRVTLRVPTQSIYLTRKLVAAALNVPVSRVRVIQATLGGSFGGKISEDANAPIAAMLSMRTGRPVRLLNRRTEDFLGARHALPERIRLRMAMTHDGELVAKEAEILADNGAYSGLSPETVVVSAFRSDNLHRLGNVRTRARLVYTNNPPSGTLRGFGASQMQFAVDSHMTTLAEILSLDPAEVQLRNVVGPGETTVHGWEIGSCGMRECIAQATAAIRWEAKRAAPPGDGPIRRGVGLGTGIFVSGNRQLGNWDGSTAMVKLDEDGGVTIVTGEGDIGQGASTVLRQLVAEELRVPVDAVLVSEADTDATPFGFGSIASRTTIIAGNVVVKAAREVRTKLLETAARLLEANPADLELRDGAVAVKGSPQVSVAFPDVCRAHLMRSGGEGIYAMATYDAPTRMFDERFYGNVAPAYSFAAAAAEVEVDVETGRVRLLDFACADDLGRALNPLTAEGQVQGAVAHGVGWALYENAVLEEGQLANPDFRDYNLPTAASLPALRTMLVETYERNGPHGAKGAGETAVVPVAGAIANAVSDAIGVSVRSLPITPEKVLEALDRADADAARATEPRAVIA